MSLAERFDSDRAWFAPSPMIDPALRRLRRRCLVGARRNEDQLIERRRRRRDVVAVEGLGVEAALDDAAGDELRDRIDAAVEGIGERAQPDGEGLRLTATEPMPDRCADMEDRLAIERLRRRH